MKIGGDYYWIGTFNAGLNRFDPKTGVFKRYSPDPGDPNSISDIYVGPVREDPSGNLWIGTEEKGLNLYHSVTDNFTRFSPGSERSISGPSIKNFFIDSKDRFWVVGGKSMINIASLSGSGFVDLWDPDKESFSPFFSGDRGEILGKAVLAMAEDAAGDLWFASEEGGLHRFDFETKALRYYNPGLGNFPEWDIRWLINDTNGHLWIGTSNVVYCLNPETEAYRAYEIFTNQPGGNQLNNVRCTEANELIFNWGSGIYIFQPEQFEELKAFQNPPTVLFSHAEVFRPDTSGITRLSLYNQDHLQLPNVYNTFNVGIKNFHFLDPQSNRIEIPFGSL